MTRVLRSPRRVPNSKTSVLGPGQRVLRPEHHVLLANPWFCRRQVVFRPGNRRWCRWGHADQPMEPLGRRMAPSMWALKREVLLAEYEVPSVKHPGAFRKNTKFRPSGLSPSIPSLAMRAWVVVPRCLARGAVAARARGREGGFVGVSGAPVPVRPPVRTIGDAAGEGGREGIRSQRSVGRRPRVRRGRGVRGFRWIRGVGRVSPARSEG